MLGEIDKVGRRDIDTLTESLGEDLVHGDSRGSRTASDIRNTGQFK